MEDDELEYTLLNKRDVLVYQIPPASSASGHKADDWKRCIWRGRCRIVGKGTDLAIKMIESSTGQLFAQCVIPNGDIDKYVERVVDSSRYFVLKISKGNQHRFIGLGFEDRNDAFDFNCTISDFKSTWVDRDKEISEMTDKEPCKDLSLKDGQKITINLKGVTGSRKRESNQEASGGGFGGILAPPPPVSGTQSRRQQTGTAAPQVQPPPMQAPQQQQQQQFAAPMQFAAPAPAAQQQDDFFGDFADFQAAPVAVSAPPKEQNPVTPAASMPATFEAQNEFGDFNFASAEPVQQANVVQQPLQPMQPVPAQHPVLQTPQPQQAPMMPPPPQQPQQSQMSQPPQQQQQQTYMAPPATASRGPAVAPPQSFDPFAGIAVLGSGQQQAPAQTSMQPTRVQQGSAKQRDPFDEFDIFK